MTLVGGIARYAFSSMLAPVSQLEGLPGAGMEVLFSNGPFSRTSSVFLTIPTVILVLGVLVMLAGAILTALLWRERNKNP